MIRTKEKVFGEENAKNTCKTLNTMTYNRLIISNSKSELEALEPKDKNGNITSGIYYIDENGKPAFLATEGPNKLLGIAPNGTITWINIA